MKTKHCVAVAIIVALAVTAGARAETVAELFHKGVYQEETAGNLDAAMRIYQQIAADEKSNRPYVAQARYRLGMCHLKKGQQNEAVEVFEKLIEAFPQQAKLVEQARAQLTALGRLPDVHPESELVWTYPTLTWTMAPSPDGRYVAFQDAETGDLALHDLKTGENRRLTHNRVPLEANTYNVRFSTDSQWIAYDWYHYQEDQQKADLHIIRIDGSGMRILYQPTGDVERIMPMAWFPDGTRILGRIRREGGGLRLVVVSVADGSVREIEGRYGAGYPLSLSPNGRYIAHDSWDENIVILPVNGGEEIPVVEHPADDHLLGWTPDGGMLIFRSNRRGQGYDAWGIQIVDGKPQGRPQCLIKNLDQAGRVSGTGHFTRDGSFYHAVFKGPKIDGWIASLDLETGKVTNPIHASQSPRMWSPDGKHLVYTATGELVIRSVDTGQERKIPLPSGVQIGRSMPWSPDGRSIMVMREVESGSRWELCQLEVPTGRITTIVPPSYGQKWPVGWSADGKGIFFTRDHWDPATEKSTTSIVVYSLETGQEQELYRNEGTHFYAVGLSPDRQQMAFCPESGSVLWQSDPKALMVLPAEGGKVRELFRVQEGCINRAICWTPDGRHILCARRYQNAMLFVRPGRSKPRPGQCPNRELWRIPVAGGEPQELEHFADLGGTWPCVHPDGKQIAYTKYRFWDDELLVMKGFLPELALPQTLTGTDDSTRPFGLTVEVPDPESDDVKELAARVKLSGADDDRNAPQWCGKVHQGKRSSLDGLWESRKGGIRDRGTAQVNTVGDWVYILDYDDGYRLIKARRQGNRLMGRCIDVDDPVSRSDPWVGLIVNNERIDGTWTGGTASGRYDLRRDLLPSVELTTPASENYIAAGESVLLKADVTGAQDVTVRRVEFLIDGAPVGEVTNPPYEFNWDRSTRGHYWATARIYDSAGGIEETPAVDFLVGMRVRNPSFEEDEVIWKDPTFRGWWVWTAYRGRDGAVELDGTEAIDGARSLRIHPRGDEDWEFIVVNSHIALEVGQRYTMSFWAKATAPRPLTAYFKAGPGNTWGNTDFQLATNWTKYSMSSVASRPWAHLEFSCTATDDTFWLDHVSVVEDGDEPREPD